MTESNDEQTPNTPTASTYTREIAYKDTRGRVVLLRYAVDGDLTTASAEVATGKPRWFGVGMISANGPDGMPLAQRQFQYPIEATTLAQAFDRMDEAMEAAQAMETQRLRAEMQAAQRKIVVPQKRSSTPQRGRLGKHIIGRT